VDHNSFDENSLLPVPNEPHSLAWAPSDFWLFGNVKISLASYVFNGVDKLLEAVIEF
jgi:hypothetical protein